MKKLTLLFSLCCLISISLLYAQAPALQWQRAMGGTQNDDAFAVQQTSDGGFISAGQTQSNNGNVSGNHGDNDFWVVKQDADGNILWQKALGGLEDETAFSVQQTTDGGYILAGQASSFNGQVTGNHGNLDFWVVKLDADGNLIWEKSLGGSNSDFATSVEQTSEGGYIIAGGSSSTDGDVGSHHGPTITPDYWIVKLDASGNEQWAKDYGGSSSDIAYSVRQTNDGGYIVAGNSESRDGDVTGVHDFVYGDYWVIKLDNSGNLVWEKAYGGSDYEQANSIRQTTDNGYIIAGWNRTPNNGDVTGNHGNYDVWLVKTDVNGNLTWEKSFGGSAEDFGYGVEQTSDGGYVVSGGTASNDGDVTGNHGLEDFWVIKTDANGSLQWQTALGGNSYDEARSIDATTDGGYIVAGYTNSTNGNVSNNHGGHDFWVARLQGCLCGAPSSGFTATNITATSAKLQWSVVSCALGYKVRYRQQGTTAWTTVKISKNTGSKKITGLTASTTYEWEVASKCSANPVAYSDFSAIQTFTTLASREGAMVADSKLDLSVAPNPASTTIQLKVSFAENGSIIELMNLMGQVVMSKTISSENEIIDISGLSTGVYYAVLKSGNGIVTRKFVKE